MKKLFLLFLFFVGISLSASATTWLIETADGGGYTAPAGALGNAFRNANDGDIIEFNIAETDTIVLTAVLERREDKKGTSITINGINQATGNPMVISGEKITTSIYRSRSNDASPMNIDFNNLVFYKGNNPGNPGGAIGLGHSTHTQVSNVKFKDCTFTECEASGNGGALNAGQGTALTLENCTFMDNKSASEGGALSIGHSTTDPDNSAVIINCTFYNNEAVTDGGALRSGPNANTSEQIINCTFVGNKVTGTTPNGGGVMAVGNSATYLVNCIIAENTADNDVSGANINLQNCIVGTKNVNVVNETNPVPYAATIFAGSAAELKDNGGYTQTIAISQKGAAYKAGVATLDDFIIPATDQRGVDRLSPPCIGAFDDPAAESTIWTITTNTGDATDEASFGYAFGHAADGDIIAFNISGTDTIALSATLSRGTSSTFTNYQGTTITINGINEATGNPIVIDGSQGAAGNSIYRSHSSDYSAMHMIFNNMVFYKASGSGGGAFNLGHSQFTQVTHVTFNGCTFEECNGTGGNGGAINAAQDIALTLENCTFINNVGATQGGAVSAGSSKSIAGCNAVITNCTFYGNTATGTGGALYSSPLASDPAQVINCTFVGNTTTATSGGGVDAEGGSATTMVNCIAAGNTPDDVMGANLALQNCIVQTKDATVVTETNPVAFAASIFAGGVAELKDNGGTTQTIAISNDGAAYEAGVATLAGFVIPTEDQRGIARLNPPCIGAFDAPTESGIVNGLASVSSQSFAAFAIGKQIQIVSANAGWATIYDLTGNVIDKACVNGNTILPTVLNSGIYLVRLTESNGNISTAKVLVK